MPETIRVGIAGLGWPGGMHARGYRAAGGFRIVAVADLIPQRRQQAMAWQEDARQYATAEEMLCDRNLDAVSICLPTDLHATVALAALRAGKHVLCEPPPALTARDARRLAEAARKHGKVLLYAFQRRFGGNEQAAKQAICRGFIGEPYHIRACWTRTRGIPSGTGWYTQKQRSGGGAWIDLGLPMLDIAWHLLGQPRPASASAIMYGRLGSILLGNQPFDVEDQAFVLMRFQNGRSVELAVSWAIHQPPQQNGTVCRVYGTEGAIEVYTAQGAVVYRDFTAAGDCKANPLKPPRITHYAAMMRHFRDCIGGRTTPLVGPAEGLALMQMAQAAYQSSQSGRTIPIG